MALPDHFIDSALQRIDAPDVQAVGIVGSYARGQEARDGMDRTLNLIVEAGYL
jgi:hypothetical protein